MAPNVRALAMCGNYMHISDTAIEGKTNFNRYKVPAIFAVGSPAHYVHGIPSTCLLMLTNDPVLRLLHSARILPMHLLDAVLSFA
jgi:hypothetical protein